MLRRRLNLGILAHVDAGKTTLTERLLYAAGVIDEIGSVDAGTTQTDSLALEQQRGITIRSAVVSFAIGDVTVNLIDTPGHPDFIAEVERVLNVLDGVVLVVSAVEGVQPQTRVLMRALQRLRIPTLLFVNKADRVGSDSARVLAEIQERLTPAAIATGSLVDEGTRGVVYTAFADAEILELLAEHDDALLAAYLADETSVTRTDLAVRTREARVHPVFFGSAITGAGVDALMSGIAELLPANGGDADGPLSAAVFKIDRGPNGEKVAYARIFSGTIRVRDRLDEARITAVGVFDGGPVARSPSAAAGQICKLWGLREVQIGDAIGERRPRAPAREFAPPTLESVVVPANPAEGHALYVALSRLAEQDPLIDVRRDDVLQELSVSRYGEVQKEVIQATLADDFGLDVEFHETTPIHVERPIGIGEAVEVLNADSNPFRATIGLRVTPGPRDSGVDFRLDVDTRGIPLYVFKRLENFAAAMEEYVRATLREGLFGWQVTDCVVTMTESNYSSPDGPPSTRGPLSTAADFRKLTPLVLMRALDRAGTVVCEPVARLSLEVPTMSLGAVLPALARLGAPAEMPSLDGDLAVVETALPSARVHDLQRQLPALTGGEGVLESSFGGYQPVRGEQPTRRRTSPNPLNFDEYMMHLARRV